MESIVHRELMSSSTAIDRSYFGVWVLNVKRSQFVATPAPIEGRRFHRDQRHGLISVVSDMVEANGVPSRRTFVFRPDGQKYIISDESHRKEDIALTAIDPFTVEFVLQREGEATANGVQRLSPDGRTLTIETCVTDANRARLASATIWEKKEGLP